MWHSFYGHLSLIGRFLETCSEGEFTCVDYTCIPEAKACDGVPDCPDSSDEKTCGKTPAADTYKDRNHRFLMVYAMLIYMQVGRAKNV